MKEVNAPKCGREDDLIAFLYGELNDVEARTFQRHVHDCPACGAELASFQHVRESVVAWRDESLSGVILPNRIADLPPSKLTVEKPSALAALREFFNLAPLWMKGALAFASILFCLFAGLAIARFRDSPPAVIVANPGYNAPSDEHLNALVQRRVQEELQRIKSSQEPTSTTIAGDKTTNNGDSWRRGTNRVNIAGNDPIQKARRPLSKTERQQLAADLRLIAANDSELDLLDDGINQ